MISTQLPTDARSQLELRIILAMLGAATLYVTIASFYTLATA